jgi:hypothetical protein
LLRKCRIKHEYKKKITRLIVCAEYARKLEKILPGNGFKQVEYHPHNPDNLKDHKVNDLPKKDQIAMAEEIQEQRLIRAVSLVKPHVAMSLSRGLYADGSQSRSETLIR